MNFKKLRKVLLVMGVATCLALPMVACGGDNGGGAGGGTNVENTPTKLGAVVLSVDDNGLATWEAVENASKYEYTLDGGATYLETTECAVQLEEGQTIKVRAVGDGVNTRHGNWSEELGFGESSGGGEVTPPEGGEDGGEVTSLARPVVTIDHTTGIASWDAVEGAKEYVYAFIYGTNIQPAGSTTETSIKIPDIYGEIVVRAKNGDVESDWSVKKVWDKTQYNPGDTPPEDGGDESELEKLPNPDVQLLENKASWSAVEGAIKYVYKIGEDGAETEVNAPVEVTLTEGQALYVKAVGDNETYEDSGWAISTTFMKTKLATPTLVRDGTRVTWSETTNATGYVVEINGVAQPVQQAREYNLTTSATIRVKAVSTNTMLYMDSDWSDSETYTKPSVALGTVSATITNNIVSWEAVENASEYEYSFNGGLTVAGTTTATTLSVDYNQSVVIRAKGDNVNYANGEWSTPVTNTSCYVLNECEATGGGYFEYWGTADSAGNLHVGEVSTQNVVAGSYSVTTKIAPTYDWTTVLVALKKNGSSLVANDLQGFSSIQMTIYSSGTANFYAGGGDAATHVALVQGKNVVTINVADIIRIGAYNEGNGYLTINIAGASGTQVWMDNVIGIVGTPSSGGNEGGSTEKETKTIVNSCDAYNSEGQIKNWIETNATTSLDAMVKTQGVNSIKLEVKAWNFINVYMRNEQDQTIPASTLAGYDYISIDIYNAGTEDVNVYFKDAQTLGIDGTLAGTAKAGEWTTLTFDSTAVSTWFGDGYCTFFIIQDCTINMDNVCASKTNN